MKKLSVIFLFLMALSISCIGFAAEQKGTTNKIAIIPYINSTEETKDYIGETIQMNYLDYFENNLKFNIIPLTETQKALNDSGFDISNLELPEKDVFVNVAKNTGADYVLAMELSQLTTTRHMSYFQAKVVSKSKLRYKFYNVKQDKLISFQVTGESQNKTIFGDVGYKDPITKALTEAMNKANEKIVSSF